MAEDIEVVARVDGKYSFPTPGDVPTSASYVWKEPGFAILRLSADDDEQDEEIVDDKDDLEPLEQRKAHLEGLDTLVRKRTLELADSGTTDMLGPRSNSAGVQDLDNRHGLLLEGDESGVTSMLLDNFFQLRPSKKSRSNASEFFEAAAGAALPRVVDKKGSSEHDTAEPPPPVASECSGLSSVTPLPEVRTAPQPLEVVMGLSVKRGISSGLEILLPGILIIDRDFDRWNSSAWKPGSVTRSQIVSPLAFEADIIASPSTGILLTTLLKAIQKPPPGQTTLAPIREQIRRVAGRYERVVVFVSEDAQQTEVAREISAFECSALADFFGFVASLDTKVDAFYVGGGEKSLCQWITSTIQSCSPCATGTRLLLIDDETTWEVFLRRAGLNAFAAQAILAVLKDETDAEGSEGYGLFRFIMMSQAERVQRFARLLGGENVIREVGAGLDTIWT